MVCDFFFLFTLIFKKKKKIIIGVIIRVSLVISHRNSSDTETNKNSETCPIHHESWGPIRFLDFRDFVVCNE